jgi:hypothetical protein
MAATRSTTLQLADIVTSCATNLVASESNWSPLNFRDGVLPMLRSDYSCIGGQGAEDPPGHPRYGSGSVTPPVAMNLSADGTKAFRLTDARAGVTLRAGDPTLKDITYGSTTQIASRAIFTLDVAGAGSAERDRFVSAITAAATAKGWLPAAPGTTPKVQTTVTGDSLTLEINTDVAMEMPTPQYGKNAVVWGMFLLSKGLGELGDTADDMQLKKAADGIADLFFRDGVEGEAYIGKYMGIPANLLRNPANGTPNLTFALMGGINSETPTSFYTAASGSLSIPMYVRSMHVTAADSG